MTDKKTEKLLKRPDAFQVSVLQSINWFKAERQRVILIIAPVTLIILAAAGFQYYRVWENGQRKNKLNEIEKVLADEEKELSKRKTKLREEIRKLENPAKDAKPGAPVPVPDVAQVLTKKNELSQMTADHKGSQAKFIEFFHANERNSEGWRAGMAAASLLVKDKKYEESAPILKTILEKSIGIDFYQVQVRLMYVAILEELKKFDEALAQVEIVQPLGSEELQSRILLTKARLQLQVGKKEDATKTLDVIITTQAATPEARQAMAIKAL